MLATNNNHQLKLKEHLTAYANNFWCHIQRVDNTTFLYSLFAIFSLQVKLIKIFRARSNFLSYWKQSGSVSIAVLFSLIFTLLLAFYRSKYLNIEL